MLNNCNYLSTNYNDQAGCIPIRIKKQPVSPSTTTDGSSVGSPTTGSTISLADIQIMLVTSGTSGINWVFPKGSIKKSESSKQAAKRETFEEAGIKGKILHQLPNITVADHNKGVNITYYPLFVGKKKNTKKEWMESSKRTRKWFRLSNVLSLIVPIKPHIETAITTLQRSIGILQQQVNNEFNLLNVPIESFPSEAITQYIVDQCKDSKKKDKKNKKDKKKLKKKNSSDDGTSTTSSGSSTTNSDSIPSPISTQQ